VKPPVAPKLAVCFQDITERKRSANGARLKSSISRTPTPRNRGWLKALDLNRPIREADIMRTCFNVRLTFADIAIWVLEPGRICRGCHLLPATVLPQAPVAERTLCSRLKAKGPRMPKNLDDEARECCRHTKAPEAGADTTFFELQRRWLFLARSYDPAAVLSCWTASNLWRSVNYEAEAGG
jgi:hypothetical protein